MKASENGQSWENWSRRVHTNIRGEGEIDQIESETLIFSLTTEESTVFFTWSETPGLGKLILVVLVLLVVVVVVVVVMCCILLSEASGAKLC